MNLGREIHVWLMKTDQPFQMARRAEECLDQEEKRKAERYLTPQLQSRFILRRAVLRHVLAQYLAILPSEIRFEFSSFGKPIISPDDGGDLQWNLSHSDEWTAIAVCKGSRIGIDIERIEHLKDTANIVEQFYSAEEKLAFTRIPHDERDVVFLKTWTCKEAYLKATGDGLSFPLDQVEVSVERASDTPRLIHIEGRPEEPTRWSVIELRLTSEVIGALVVEGSRRLVQQMAFDFKCLG